MKQRCRYCHTPLIISYDTKLPIPVKVDGEIIKRAKATRVRGHVLYWKQESGKEPIAVVACSNCDRVNVFGLPSFISKVLEGVIKWKPI